MKKHYSVDVLIHIFLTLVLVAEWSAPCPGHFNPREKAPLTHLISIFVTINTHMFSKGRGIDVNVIFKGIQIIIQT
jgi:hypothetical protein